MPNPGLDQNGLDMSGLFLTTNTLVLGPILTIYGETWGFNAGWLCRTMIHIHHIQKASCQIRFHCRSQYSSWVCKKNLVLHWAWHGVTEPPGTCIYYHLWSFRIYDRAIFSHWLLLSVVPKCKSSDTLQEKIMASWVCKRFPFQNGNRTKQLDDGWPESVEEQGLLLLALRH